MFRIARPSARALVVLAPLALAAVAVPTVAMADSAGSGGHVFRACVDQTGFVFATVMDVDPQCVDLQTYLNSADGGALGVTLTACIVAFARGMVIVLISWETVTRSALPGKFTSTS